MRRIICLLLLLVGGCASTKSSSMFLDAGERESLLQGIWQTGMSLAELEVILSVAGDGDTLTKMHEPNKYYFDRIYNDRKVCYTFQFKDDKLYKCSEDYEWF